MLKSAVIAAALVVATALVAVWHGVAISANWLGGRIAVLLIVEKRRAYV